MLVLRMIRKRIAPADKALGLLGRRLCMATLIVTCLTALGCARLRDRLSTQSAAPQETLRGDSGEWAQEYRGASDEKKLWGVDERSRQIERNLGVR
jgi:hypothetical protein